MKLLQKLASKENKMKVNTTINGKEYCLEVKPNSSLTDMLRNAGFKSVKTGCHEGSCGACAVIIDGRARNSCILPAGLAEGREISTVEGMGTPENPHNLQEAFVKHGATQCGYCNPGSLMSAKAFLDKNSKPTMEEIKDALDGNLCRCTGYVKRLEAIMDVATNSKTTKKRAGGKK